MLTATTETVVSMRRSGRRSGERTRATTCLMTRGTRAHDDHLLEGELAREREKDVICHPKEEISPVYHPDRRVSLMG